MVRVCLHLNLFAIGEVVPVPAFGALQYVGLAFDTKQYLHGLIETSTNSTLEQRFDQAHCAEVLVGLIVIYVFGYVAIE